MRSSIRGILVGTSFSTIIINENGATVDMSSFEKLDTFLGTVGRMEEKELESEVNVISERQENLVGFMEETVQEYRASDMSEDQENELECTEEFGEENKIADSFEKHENEVVSTDELGFIEETGHGSQIDDRSEKHENEVGSIGDTVQECQINVSSGKQEDDPRKWTISWKEAIKREFEYRKKMEKFLLQFPESFELLPVQPQEQIPNLHTAGMKRKAPTGMSHGDCSEDENKEVLLQKRSDQMAKSLGLPGKSVVTVSGKPEGMQEQKSQPLSYQKIIEERIQNIVPRKIVSQRSNFQLVKKFWCHVCRVNCPSLESLSKHQQGKRHINQVEIMVQQKNKSAGCELLWCQSCNVPCSGVVSMRQHLLGKRHQASIRMLRVGTSRDVVIKLHATSVDCKPTSSNLCQPECSEASVKDTVGTVTFEPAVPVVENRRIRTSSWPNSEDGRRWLEGRSEVCNITIKGSLFFDVKMFGEGPLCTGVSKLCCLSQMQFCKGIGHMDRSCKRRVVEKKGPQSIKHSGRFRGGKIIEALNQHGRMEVAMLDGSKFVVYGTSSSLISKVPSSISKVLFQE